MGPEMVKITCDVDASSEVEMLDMWRVLGNDPKSSVHEPGTVAHVQVLEVEGSRRGRRYSPEGSCGRTRFAGLAVDCGDLLAA